MRRHWLSGVAAVLLSGCSLEHSAPDSASAYLDWPTYGGGWAGDRFSELTQVNQENVRQLEVAWRFETGVGGLQTSPLMIGGTLFAYTPTQGIIALDAAEGTLRWRFDSGVAGQQPARGLSYWSDGRSAQLFAGAMDRLYALDPTTGKPNDGFGEHGAVDLRKGLGSDYTQNATYLTSPGVVYRDLIIVGFRTSESKPAARGAIRAYDVRTGALRWIFHTIPRPGEFGYETWPKDAWRAAGAANNWAGMVVDEKRGIVFVPTGSAVDDFYGADRKGDNLYANCLIALDAKTGKRLWHFQVVHHDLWDWDLGSPPVLLTVKSRGQSVDAVAQVTKHGYVFVFDRVTGEPLFPIREQTFPASDVPGESTSPTQPIPIAPVPFARQRLTENDLTNRTPEVHTWALERFRTFRSKGIFTPLAVDQKTIVFPGTDGGAEWGGAAVDRRTGVIYINSNDVAWVLSLTSKNNAKRKGAGPGEAAYASHCAMCHGMNRQGSPPQFPSLLGLSNRLSAQAVSALLDQGRGRMPAFPLLKGSARTSLIEFVLTGAEQSAQKREVVSDRSSLQQEPDYVFTGYDKFVDPDGYPAVAPPWGTLNAIDLNSGEYLWKIPFGEYPDLTAQGLKDSGTENYGGPLVTASGLLFIGATIFDRKFRAFDSRSGKLLWETELPFAGNATPITYSIHGRQYIVIACSGARDPKGPQGSAYIAFALPRAH